MLIRETGPEGWLRVSVGTASEMEAFATALADIRDNGGATPLQEGVRS